MVPDEKQAELASAHAGFDPWRALTALSPARIGLGRAGAGLRTSVNLELAAAHAAARDAVHRPWPVDAFGAALEADGVEVVRAATRVAHRHEYLRRPDLGRALSPDSEAHLTALGAARGGCDVALVVSDGLSASGVVLHGQALVGALLSAFAALRLGVAPVVLLPDGRVAASDPIGAALRARLAVMVVGERPGLSAADSLGIYLTYDPRPGRSDADRNCISNVHPPDGLDYAAAAARCAWLAREALRLGLSGVALKDEAPKGLSIIHAER